MGWIPSFRSLVPIPGGPPSAPPLHHICRTPPLPFLPLSSTTLPPFQVTRIRVARRAKPPLLSPTAIFSPPFILRQHPQRTLPSLQSYQDVRTAKDALLFFERTFPPLPHVEAPRGLPPRANLDVHASALAALCLFPLKKN